jgi:type 1 glutamine amidotransferase
MRCSSWFVKPTVWSVTSSRWAVLLALVAALVVPGVRGLAAQDSVKPDAEALKLDQKLISDAKVGSEVMANLTYLSDVIGPRLTGSPNCKRANEWAAEKMKAYGLTDVRLEPWELPVGWERGTCTARLIEPDNGRTITCAAMGWTPGTNGKVVGDVVYINARTPEELKKYEGKLKGAIVLRGAPSQVRPITDMTFSLGGPPERPSQPPAAPAGTPPAAKPEDAKKPEEAAKTQPPAGTPAAQPPGGRPTGFDSRPFADMMRMRREINDFLRKEGVAVLLQDSGKPHGLLNMTGSWGGRDRGSAQESLPTLFVTHDHYALLYRLATRPEPARTRMEVEINNKFIPGPYPVYNTVGEIKGTDKADEFVVVGAHIDSWDLGQGTTDNGTGTCVVLETARILAKCGVKPRRTIRFVLFSGEEEGLHGSRAYVERHKDEMAKTSAAIVHDTGTGKVVGLSLMGREVLKPLMEAELASLKELGVTDISTRSMGGSDHQSFEGAGVPGFMFRQDPAEYRLTHHSQSDTLDKAREPDLIQGAQVMAVIAMRIANRPEMLPRDKPAGGTGRRGAGRQTRVLIITGDHGHAWKETTPFLRDLLTKAGMSVDVTEKPGVDLTPENLAKYDVLLLNYKDTRNGAPDTRWTAEGKQAFTEAVKNGKGLVVYHHASSAFVGNDPFDKEFEKVIAGGWRKQGNHGKRHEFKLTVRKGDHPITLGLPPEFPHANDELYQNSVMFPDSTVLVTAFSDKKIDPKNSDKHEPVVWVATYGKGRVVENVLGHDVAAMQSPGFQTLMVRCVEWAATGEARAPVPDNLKPAAK